MRKRNVSANNNQRKYASEHQSTTATLEPLN